MHKKIAVLVTYDFEDAEYAEPVEAFRAARHSIINLESQAGKDCFKHGNEIIWFEFKQDHSALQEMKNGVEYWVRGTS